MVLQASTFLFDEEVAIAGERLRVVGQWQYEDGKGMVVTRYHLRDRSNNLQLLQERSSVFQFLRSFPQSMPPLAEGNTVTALGDRYVLGEVQKLKLFASAGNVPHEVLKSPLLLSGAFQGSNGSLLRELVPGAPTQTYYAVKYVEPTEIMNASRLVAADQTRKRELEESRRELEEARAVADANRPGIGSLIKKGIGIVVVVFFVGALVRGCMSSPDSDTPGSSDASSSDSNSGGGARGATGVFHGK